MHATLPPLCWPPAPRPLAWLPTRAGVLRLDLGLLAHWQPGRG
ncbi:MAG: hypothetical protein WKG07_24865 [Hymenobacter sp.]